MTGRRTDQPAAVPAEALLRCAEEPIAVPGAIQPHGVLLAVTERDLAVVIASANAAELFGRPVGGATLADLLDEDAATRLIRLVDALEDQDDVDAVHANFDVDADVLERVAG